MYFMLVRSRHWPAQWNRKLVPEMAEVIYVWF